MKVAVLGGGISGLSSAYYLAKGLSAKKLPYEIVVFNNAKDVGGWIKTGTENESSVIFEHGPRSVRTAGLVGKHTLKLINDIGLKEEILPVDSSHVSAKTRLIYANKKLHVLPNSFQSSVKQFEATNSRLLPTLIRGYLKRLPPHLESMHDVSTYRFGNDITNYLIDPFVRGVFAADIKELSMKAAFSPIWKSLGNKKFPAKKPTLKDEKSILKSLNNEDIIKLSTQNKWSQWNLKNGLQSLPIALASFCQSEMGVQILNQTNVSAMTLNHNGKVTIFYNKLDKNLYLENIDHVISAQSACDLSAILQSSTFRNSSQSDSYYAIKLLSTMLNQINFVDVGVVNLEYKGTPSALLPIVGFGHLVPSCEESKVLGVTYDSCCFPQHDRKDLTTTRLTCMMGGSWFGQLFGNIDDTTRKKLEIAAMESVAKQLNITQDPVSLNVTIAQRAIPTYRVGHIEMMNEIEEFIKDKSIPISLAGSSYWGVSINDCIYNSHIIADKLIADV